MNRSFFDWEKSRNQSFFDWETVNTAYCCGILSVDAANTLIHTSDTHFPVHRPPTKSRTRTLHKRVEISCGTPSILTSIQRDSSDPAQFRVMRLFAGTSTALTVRGVQCTVCTVCSTYSPFMHRCACVLRYHSASMLTGSRCAR